MYIIRKVFLFVKGTVQCFFKIYALGAFCCAG